MRLRLSAAAPDSGGGQHFLINPYRDGMAVEYTGVLEFWVGDFSVHFNDTQPYYQGRGANFFVGDEIDSGGLYVTALNNGGHPYTTLAADTFAHLSHGDLRFIVRNPTDKVAFQGGAYGAETTHVTVDGTGNVLIGAEGNAGQKGRLTIQPQNAGQVAVTVVNNGSATTADLLDLSDAQAGVQSRFNHAGTFVTRVGTPSSGDLNPGEVALSVDANGNLVVTSNVAGTMKRATVTVS